MGFYHKDDTARLKRDLEYAQQEARETRDRLEQERERYQREAQAQRNEIYRQIEERRREASDWREALVKQRALLQREIDRFPEEEDQAGTSYFARLVEQCDRALAAWDEIAPQLQEEIAPWQERIKAAQQRFLDTVAQRGGSEIETAFHEYDDPSDWLNW